MLLLFLSLRRMIYNRIYTDWTVLRYLLRK